MVYCNAVRVRNRTQRTSTLRVSHIGTQKQFKIKRPSSTKCIQTNSKVKDRIFVEYPTLLLLPPFDGCICQVVFIVSDVKSYNSKGSRRPIMRTQTVIRAIGVSHTACKDEFPRNLRSPSRSVFVLIIARAILRWPYRFMTANESADNPIVSVV